MQITKLFYKPQKGKPLINANSLTLTTGYGIHNDIHAQWGSPRQVLIVSQSTLDDFHLQAGDLGENIVVNADIEAYQSGQVLKFGKDVLIRLMFHCEPCKNLEQVQTGLMKKIKIRRGFLGFVIEGGEIKKNDQVTVTPYQFPCLTDQFKPRFAEFIDRIPDGKLVNTTDLLLALGVSKAYYRSIPILIKKAKSSLPTYKLVKKDGSLFTKYIPNQPELLRQQGIVINNEKVNYPNYAWEYQQYHQIKLGG